MAELTYLDELAEYPLRVLEKIASRQEVLDLVSGRRQTTQAELKNENGSWKYFFDYPYPDGTVQEPAAYVTAEVEKLTRPTPTVKALRLTVTAACHRSALYLDPAVFPEFQGNRLTNLLRHLDAALGRGRDFGLGRLELYDMQAGRQENELFLYRRLRYDVKVLDRAGR